MRHPRLGIAAAALLAATAGCDTARTLERESELGACDRCHGFPPATTRGGEAHPTVAADAAACSTCHSDTVDPTGAIIVGGAHQNGRADASVAHAVPFVAEHPGAALAQIASCKGCHGDDYGGGTSGVSCTGCHAGVGAGFADWQSNCTFCHGARTAGVTTATPAAAPPQAVVATGDQTSANPKVGAHQAHLEAGTFSAPIACASCHAVPTGAGALTHFQGAGAPGAVSFGAVATKGAAGAAYTGGTCNVYCHGAGTEFPDPTAPTLPAWTATSVACGNCHDLPPASGPTIGVETAHVFHVGRGLQCTSCHPALPDQHVNGTKNVVVQPGTGGPVTITGWDCGTCHDALGVASHPVPFVAQHTSFALADIGFCTACHGADYAGGTSGVSCTGCHQGFGFADWQTNCTFCHGTRTTGVSTATPAAAPPQTVVVTADQTTSNPRIGAHQKHLGVGATLSNGIACTECHPAATSLAHVGGSGTAQLGFGPLATSGGAAATMTGGTCSNYCHGATTPGTQAAPTWSPPSAMTCASCHEASPTTGQHPSQNADHAAFTCVVCHGTGFTSPIGAAARPLHVDGAINKAASIGWDPAARSCSPGCHGTENWN